MVQETAQVLAQVAQAIGREDATVTHDLHNIFHSGKRAGPMVTIPNNAYKILAEDISIHYQATLDTLLAQLGGN